MKLFILLGTLILAIIRGIWWVLCKTGLVIMLTVFPALGIGFTYLGQTVAAQTGNYPTAFSPLGIVPLLSPDRGYQGLDYLGDWAIFWAFVISAPFAFGILVRTIIRLIKHNPGWTYRAAIQEWRQAKQTEKGTANIQRLAKKLTAKKTTNDNS